MTKLFDETRTYVLGDPELKLIGSKEKLSQWRHRSVGPAFYRMGRRIIYHGTDLNEWAATQRVEGKVV